jgi:hypothetical protein
MEAKYSSFKLDEILEQLKKDHSIISNLKNEKVLYLGIMNDYMAAYNFINLYLNFDCIIMLIKNYIFYGRDVRRFYDWGLIQNVTEMKNDISILKNDISILKNEIAILKSGFDDLKGGFDDLKVKLDLIISNMSIKRVTLRKIKNKKKYLASKKRKRDKKDKNDNNNSSDS